MSITCRPDISVTVSKCARGMHSPEESHVKIMIELLKYLKGTKDRGLVFRHNSPVHDMLQSYQSSPEGKETTSFVSESPCVAFSDASWADGDDPKLRSTSGYCVYVFGCFMAHQATDAYSCFHFQVSG